MMRVAITESGAVTDIVMLDDAMVIDVGGAAARGPAVATLIDRQGNVGTFDYVTIFSAPAGGTLISSDLADVGWSWTKGGGFVPPPPVVWTAADLASYAAVVRFAKETAIVTVGGHGYDTARESRGNYTGAVLAAQLNPAATFNWKTSDGSFVTLNATQITAVAVAVMTYVQSAYTVEQTVLAGINASPPTITTKAQVDTAFAAL